MQLATPPPLAEISEIIKRSEKQVIELVMTHPFFASLFLGLNRGYTEDVETMATDGASLLINPQFCHTLSDPEILGTYVHEALHVALGHPWRKGDRDHEKANIAMDYAINQIIDDFIQSGVKGIALPPGALLDPKYAGMSWEEIYAKLPDPPPPPPGGQGGQGSQPGNQPKPGNKCGPGEVLDGVTPVDPQTGRKKSNDDMIAEAKRSLAQAAQAARMQGNLPAAAERLVDEILAPKVPWRTVLRRFLTEIVRNDYDWMKPDRRFLPDDIYIPDIGDEEAAGEIVVAFDTSGSIDGPMLDAFMAEVNAIHSDLRPIKTHCVACDAAVHNTAEFGPDDTIIFRPQGGGGTSFEPVFDWVEKQRINCKALVYLTDLYGSHRQDAPGYPVLWASWSDCTDVPYGEVVQVKE
jgi:predicted metal-dependent peptidase